MPVILAISQSPARPHRVAALPRQAHARQRHLQAQTRLYRDIQQAAFQHIKDNGSIEHAVHIRNSGNMPGRDIAVESNGASEHVAHGGDRTDIPGRDIAVERGGTIEHAVHIRDRSDIPGRQVLVEGLGIVKHMRHVRDSRDVPGGDTAVEGGGTIKHCETGCVCVCVWRRARW